MLNSPLNISEIERELIVLQLYVSSPSTSYAFDFGVVVVEGQGSILP